MLDGKNRRTMKGIHNEYYAILAQYYVVDHNVMAIKSPQHVSSSTTRPSQEVPSAITTLLGF